MDASWTPECHFRRVVRNSLKALVGPPGFEPGTSCTPSKRASQAAPRPERIHFSAPALACTALALQTLCFHRRRHLHLRHYQMHELRANTPQQHNRENPTERIPRRQRDINERQHRDVQEHRRDLR